MFTAMQQEVYQVHQGIQPITLKILRSLKMESSQMIYKNMSLQIVSIVCRFCHMKLDASSVRIAILANDDSATLKLFYFMKDIQDEEMMKLLREEDWGTNYYRIIVQIKVYKDFPQYNILKWSQCASNQLIHHLCEVMKSEVKEPFVIHSGPLKEQVHSMLKHYGFASTRQIMIRLKCTMQQLNYAFHELKQEQRVLECIDPNVYQTL